MVLNDIHEDEHEDDMSDAYDHEHGHGLVEPPSMSVQTTRLVQFLCVLCPDIDVVHVLRCV